MFKNVMYIYLCMIVFASAASGGDLFYYVGQDSVPITISDSFIAVQFDSMTIIPGTSAFIASHPCLSGISEERGLDRGFFVFSLSQTCGYSLAAGDLMMDPTVSRVTPVYLTPDSAELYISDLVSVQFLPSLDWDSVHSILAAYDLSVVESTLIAPNLVLAELEDTISGGPLEIGNDLHELEKTM